MKFSVRTGLSDGQALNRSLPFLAPREQTHQAEVPELLSMAVFAEAQFRGTETITFPASDWSGVAAPTVSL
jgi:hypothetical protein